jgi:hypothetical protein
MLNETWFHFHAKKARHGEKFWQWGNVCSKEVGEGYKREKKRAGPPPFPDFLLCYLSIKVFRVQKRLFTISKNITKYY